MGQLANSVRSQLEEAIDSRRAALEEAALEAKLEAEALDVTLPGKRVKGGHKHPMDIVIDELKDIFIGMGFEVDDGPEVEESIYNFDRLNTDEGHPAREWTDTFYLDEEPHPAAHADKQHGAAHHGDPRDAHTRRRLRPAATARTRLTPPTAPCSTRWRAWSWTSTSPSPT